MGVPIIPLTLVGELRAALRAAAGENLAAVAGGHSLAEAVLFLALALLGLIGTEHVLHSFLDSHYAGFLFIRLYSTAEISPHSS